MARAATDLSSNRGTTEGDDPEVVLARTKNEIIYKYMMTNKLSEEAYTYLGLPKKYYKSQEEFMELSQEEIDAAGGKTLDDTYFEMLTEDANEEFDRAEELTEKATKTFRQGRRENYLGDQFAFTGILFTVCLFLAGIGLVFKSNIKWVFGGLSVLALFFAMGDMFSNPWTEPTEIPDVPAASASPNPGGAPAADDGPEADEPAADDSEDG